MDKDYVEMGERILIYPNDRVIYGNRELNTDKFIILINLWVNSEYKINFYEALSGFTVHSQKTGEHYHLEFSNVDIENYKNGIYTRITRELQKALLLQEQRESSSKSKSKK